MSAVVTIAFFGVLALVIVPLALREAVLDWPKTLVWAAALVFCAGIWGLVVGWVFR